MWLRSQLFKDDPQLAACYARDNAHIVQGASGGHVAKIQWALFVLDGLGIDRDELCAERYGPSTAAAVLAFKIKRQIVNYSYQTKSDNIVGKMTIAALDGELLRKQGLPSGLTHVYVGDQREGHAAGWK